MISYFLNKFSRKASPPQKGMLVGTRCRGGQPIVLDDSVLRSHVALSGRGGVGRSRLLKQVLTQQTVDGRGWVHIDPSGDERLRDHLASVAHAAGRADEFYVLDLVDPDNSNTYDILRGGTAESRAHRVLTLFPVGANPYSRRLGGYLTVLFSAIDATGKSAGLLEVAQLLMSLGTPAVREQLLAAIPEGHPAGAALVAALDELAQDGLPEQRLKNLGGGAAGRLTLLGTLKCSNIFNNAQPEIDFEDVLTHGKMCLVRLSPMHKDTVVLNLARMVLQDVCSAIPARAGLPGNERAPFLVAMDSFPGYGLSESLTAPLSDATWSQARGMNVSLIPVVDSGNWDQVHDAYRTDGLTGNTFTKVYFQQDASEHLAEQHPAMPADALQSLKPGQFVMCQGDAVVAGELRYTDTGTPPGFTKQAMPTVSTGPRLQLPELQIST
jgi:intracellular multiplication protein IcmO